MISDAGNLDQRVCRHPMSDDTQQDGAAGDGKIVSFPGSFSLKTMIPNTIVASPRGPNQAINSLSAASHSGASEAQKYRNHPDHSQAQDSVEQRRPGEPSDDLAERSDPERHPGQQRQRFAGAARAAQQLLLVRRRSPLNNSPPTKQAMKPLPPTACAAAKQPPPAPRSELPPSAR